MEISALKNSRHNLFESWQYLCTMLPCTVLSLPSPPHDSLTCCYKSEQQTHVVAVVRANRSQVTKHGRQNMRTARGAALRLFYACTFSAGLPKAALERTWPLFSSVAYLGVHYECVCICERLWRLLRQRITFVLTDARPILRSLLLAPITPQFTLYCTAIA